MRGIHRSPVNSPHKGQWRGALMFSLICVWINGWVNNREVGDLRRYRASYDVTVMRVLLGLRVIKKLCFAEVFRAYSKTYYAGWVMRFMLLSIHFPFDSCSQPSNGGNRLWTGSNLVPGHLQPPGRHAPRAFVGRCMSRTPPKQYNLKLYITLLCEFMDSFVASKKLFDSLSHSLILLIHNIA